MKLIKFGEVGREKPGVIYQEKRLDTSAFTNDYNEGFFSNNGLYKLETFIETHADSLEVIDENIRLGCPIGRPSKIVCIGLNYANHAKETNAPIPSEPVIFLKSTTALAGPHDEIQIPLGSTKTDWEVELAVVIGKRASSIKQADALDYIAGFLVHNDVSEREYQLERNGTWDKGKGCDTFAPLGPYLITPDDLPDWKSLNLWLDVNGQRMQQGNTSDLIFDIPFLIAYVSRFMTLLPGDVISTGTPAGVGLGFNPQIYLKPGDIVELGIDYLGSQRQVVTEYKNLQD